MKRDMSMIRDVLLRVEEQGGIDADGQTWDDPMRHHQILAVEAGLAVGTVDGSLQGLTLEGRDFLDMARNDDVWDAVESQIEDALDGSAPFDVWVGLLSDEIAARLER